MMKDIITYVPTAKRQTQMLEYAISLASSLKSHLQGMAFTFLPAFSGIYATMPGDFYTAILNQARRTLMTLVVIFSNWRVVRRLSTASTAIQR
jgi:hypothetical protein